MRNYRVEHLDIRDDTIVHIDYVKANLFVVDDDHITVTFFVENANSSMTPVAMFPFSNIDCIITEEGDCE